MFTQTNKNKQQVQVGVSGWPSTKKHVQTNKQKQTTCTSRCVQPAEFKKQCTNKQKQTTSTGQHVRSAEFKKNNEQTKINALVHVQGTQHAVRPDQVQKKCTDKQMKTNNKYKSVLSGQPSSKNNVQTNINKQQVQVGTSGQERADSHKQSKFNSIIWLPPRNSQFNNFTVAMKFSIQ
jgi:putative cell wall-binding protein